MGSALEERNFKSFDGTELFSHSWTSSAPKALVIGVHGLGEHSECYKFLGQALSQKNYKLTMFDHRGHGRSQGKRGAATIDEFVLDLKIFIEFSKKNNPGLPHFYLGHSMGGLVLIKYLIRNGLGQSLGTALSSPLLGVSVKIPGWKTKLSRVLAKTLPEVTLHNEIDFNSLSHDSEVVKSYERDHHRHDRISSPLFMSMLDSIDYCFTNYDKLQGPMYFQIAGDEKIVSRPDTEKFYKLLNHENKDLKIYEGYYHEIYNEVKRNEVFEDLIKWLDKRLAK